jgi:DNA-binding CsgD family transcriptional regulator
VARPIDEESLAWAAGSGQQWTLDWLTDNARIVAERAPRTAADLLRHTLAWLPAADQRRLPLQASLVRVAFQLADNDEVERTGRLVMVAREDPDHLAEMAWFVAYSQLRCGRPADARSTASAALARPGVSDLRAARLEGLVAVILAMGGDAAEAERAGLSALRRARQASDPIGAGYALHARSCAAIFRRDVSGAIDLFDEALAELGQNAEASYIRNLVLSNKAGHLHDLDRFSEAMAAAREAVVEAERAASPRLAGARFGLADQYYFAGLWDDALAELEPAVASQGHDYQPLLVRGLTALIAAHRNDRKAAVAYLRGLPDDPLHADDGGMVASAFQVVLARAILAEQDDDIRTAVSLLAPYLDPAIASRVTSRSHVLPMLTRLAFAAGDETLAAGAADAAEAEAEAEAAAGTPHALKQALASHSRGLARNDPGLVQSAAAYLGSTGRRLMGAEADEDAAVLLALQGDGDGARRALAAACRNYAELGAHWDLSRAAGRLRPFGIRWNPGSSRRRPVAGWAALTPTELRVAALVARGRSNPDIAAELCLSRNTVQTHVSHILAKLSARSRVEIVREALHQPGNDPTVW